MGLMGFFFFVRGAIHPPGNHQGASTPSQAAPPATGSRVSKPWGDLEYTPMVLERPEEMFATNNVAAPPLRWFFPGYTRQQVEDLLAACDLPALQKTALLDPARSEPANRGWVIRPAPEIVKELAPTARARIYAVLGESTENPGPAYPFVYRKDGFEEWFSGCSLPADKIALVRSLSYPKRDALCFADLQLFELLSSSNDTHCLVKTLCRVPTLMMKVKIKADTDLDALLDYWGACGRAKSVKPLLKSLARLPEGGEVNVSYFLPAVPRLRLYTYPDPARPAREDCFWSSFNFFNDEPEQRFLDPVYADKMLQSDFQEVRGEKRFGDIMLLLEAGDRAVHMCVYMADDIVYTKNGGHLYQPWVLMRIADMMVQYPSDKPQQWRVFRKRPS